MGYHWAECSGYNPEMVMRFPKEEYLKLTQWVYIENKTIFSHAGVSQVWMDNVGISSPEEINDLPPSDIFGFWPDIDDPVYRYDIYGDSPTQGPVWIRPQTLARCCVEGYTQVVGHTVVKHGIVNIKEAVKCKQDIWLCDAMHVHQYLKITDGNVEICRFES